MNIAPRTSWTTRPRPGTTIATPLHRLFLHHSVTVDRGLTASMREVDAIHRQRFGAASGFGYSWGCSMADLAIAEGRGPGRSGAHTLGWNTHGHALVVFGNFEYDRPTDQLVDLLARFAAWYAAQGYGPGRFHGHRDVGSTACPGRRLYAALPEINRRAARLAASPSDPLEALMEQLTDRQRTNLLALADLNPTPLANLLAAAETMNRNRLERFAELVASDKRVATLVGLDRGIREEQRSSGLGVGRSVVPLVRYARQRGWID